MRWAIITFFIALSTFAQERPIFVKFDKSQTAEYEEKFRQIEDTSLSELEAINKKIILATAYKHFDDLIDALEEKIEVVETAELRYYLGGINGIKALSVYRLFALPYVRSMLINFKRAIALDPNYTPAIEAYIESLCLVPSIIGGDIRKAKELSNKLLQLNTVEGYFSKGFIAKSLGKKEAAKTAYSKAFIALDELGFCSENKRTFFKNKSLNFSFKIAEVSAYFGLYPTIGLCAIDYFIEQKSYLYNIPLEWAYYRKAQLHFILGNKEQGRKSLDEALSINTSFLPAQQLKKTI